MGLAVAAVAAAGASRALASPESPGQGRKVVVMASGSRLEVQRAWPEGDTYHLELAGGSSLVVPASAVRRISSSAADLPVARAVPVTARPATDSAGAAPMRASAPATGRTGAGASAALVKTEIAPAVPAATAGTPSRAAQATPQVGPFANIVLGPGVLARYITRLAPRGAGATRDRL